MVDKCIYITFTANEITMSTQKSTQKTEYQGISIRNKANFKYVKSAVNWLIKHNEADRLRNIADGEGDERAYNKYDRQCERTFDKYLEYCEELPKYQVKLIEQSLIY